MEQSIKDDSTSNGAYNTDTKKGKYPNILFSEDEMKPDPNTSRNSS